MLLSSCLTVSFLTNLLAVLAMEGADPVPNGFAEISAGPSNPDNILLALSRLQLSDSSETRAEPRPMETEFHSILSELRTYGIEDITAPNISGEEHLRRTTEYYERCAQLPIELLCKIVRLDDEQVRSVFINNRLVIELASDLRKREELEESFGDISWPDLARQCRNLSVLAEGFQNLPRKAVLAFMNSNSPWDAYLNDPPTPNLCWKMLFEFPIGSEYADLWKYLTRPVVLKAYLEHNAPIDEIALVIAHLPAAKDSVKRVLQQFVRIIYLERILIGVVSTATILELLKVAVRDLGDMLVSLRASNASWKENALDKSSLSMVYRPPSGIASDYALTIYGQEPATTPADSVASAAIEAELDSWAVLLDSEWPDCRYCKVLLLMRHLDVLPDTAVHRQLRKTTNEGQLPLPLSLIRELAANPKFSSYEPNLGLLKDCLYSLSEVRPLFAIEYALTLGRMDSAILSRMILADAPKAHFKQLIVNSVRNPASPKTIVLPNPNSESMDLVELMTKLSLPWFQDSRSISFVTLAGHELASSEADEWFGKYLEILFDSRSPPAFIRHHSGFYFPAHGLNRVFMQALKFLFARSISGQRIKIPGRISPQYFSRLQKSGGGLATVQDVYGDFLDQDQDILAASKYLASYHPYTNARDESIDRCVVFAFNAFHSALLSGELEEGAEDDLELAKGRTETGEKP